jgi:lysophospholipase L1-like esterase
MKRLTLVQAAIAIAACTTTPTGTAGIQTSAQNGGWIESWGAPPEPPSVKGGFFGASPSWKNQTLRQVVRLSAGGAELRVRLTNEYGAADLLVGAATVAPAGEGGALAGKPIPLTFSGKPAAVIRAGAPILSDPVILPTKALQSLAISLYLPNDTGPCTCHLTGAATTLVSAPGDFTKAATFKPAATLTQRAFLSSVDVLPAGGTATIIALGDSITDGVGATADCNDRWPDKLAERLVARGGAVTYGLSNQGISGNRLLSGGAGVFGDSVLARFDRDVLSAPGVKYVILFIGVNDLGQAFGARAPAAGAGPSPFAGLPQTDVSVDAMLAGYRQVIARAHVHGLKVYGATIIPYGGATYWSKEGEATRLAINTWIRTGREFDGVIDFDAAMRDPKDPSKMADGLHLPDFLHATPAGLKAMADAVDLSLFP